MNGPDTRRTETRLAWARQSAQGPFVLLLSGTPTDTPANRRSTRADTAQTARAGICPALEVPTLDDEGQDGDVGRINTSYAGGLTQILGLDAV